MSDIQVIKLNSGQQTEAQICAKIAQIDGFLALLYDEIPKSIARGNYQQYELDTGQTKTKVTFRSPKEVAEMVATYELLRRTLAARLSPRSFRLMDGENFR